MNKKRRIYLTKAQKAEVLSLFLSRAATRQELAQTYNVHESTIGNIVRDADPAVPTRDPLDPRLLDLAHKVAALTAEAKTFGVQLTVTTKWI